MRRAGFAVVAAVVLLAFARVASPVRLDPGPIALNFVESSPALASSGMPRRAQFQRIREHGFDIIVNLAPSDATGAHDDEEALVRGNGMGYYHVPVDFAAPTKADYERFAAVLAANRGRRILVHCQFNLRASSFVYLYRVVELGEDPDAAFDDVAGIWQPSAQWRRLIREVLRSRGRPLPMALA